MTGSDLVRHAPLALWRIAEIFLHTLHNLFGAPEDVARQHTFTLKAYALLLSWLRCGEALMRRLLLIEAQAWPKPNTRPLLHEKRRRARKQMVFTPDHPETWRVSFRSMDHRRPAGMRRRRPAKAPALHVRFRSAWPLAERYEALLRVFNNPAPYARRLARRLYATPHRAGELLRAPPEAARRIEGFSELAAEARAWPPNTS